MLDTCRERERIVHQGCHHLLLNWFLFLIRCVELRLDARNTVTGYCRFHCGRVARGFPRIDEAQPPLTSFVQSVRYLERWLIGDDVAAL